MPEEHPVGTFPPTEATPAPEIRKMPLDELSELVKWPSKLEEFAEERTAAQPPATPEPEPEPEQPPVDTPPAPEPVVETAPAAEPEPVPAEPSQEDVEKELLRAQVEAIEAHAKKLEAKLQGREAGERGYIKQLKDRLQRLESGETVPQAPPEPEYRPETEAVPAPHDSIKAWAIQKASQEALANFVQSHPDVKDMEQEAVKYLQESGFDARSIFQLDDPIAAGREVTRFLDEAYWHVRETATRSRISELQTRKADQVRGLEEAKKRAAPSASGSPPAPAAQRKTTKDLSLAELDAQVKSMRSGGR